MNLCKMIKTKPEAEIGGLKPMIDNGRRKSWMFAQFPSPRPLQLILQLDPLVEGLPQYSFSIHN